MSASTETTKSLTVTTDDGDKVTLTTHTAAQLGYARYDYRGRLDGERVRFSAEALNVTVSQDVSLSVEGDLSDQEKADIAKLVDVLQGAAQKDAAENPTGAVASALGGDLGSLAGFEYTVTRAVNVSIAQVSRATKGTPAAVPANGGAPAAVPARGTPAPAVPAPAADAGTSPAPASTPATQAAPAGATGDDDTDDKSVKNLADAVRGSGIRVDKLLRHLRRILDQLAQRLDLLTAAAFPASTATDPAATATDPAATPAAPATSSDTPPSA